MNKLFSFHPLLKMKYLFTNKKYVEQIPHGSYCYTTIFHNMETGVTATEPCPYLKRHNMLFGLVEGKFNWCSFLNSGDDMLINDECKWCKIHEDFEDLE